LVFPVHPRTRQRLKDFRLLPALEGTPSIKLTQPLSYIEFMSLVSDCRFALTDSGGVQEETSYLGIPCLTLRENTERPITVSLGTNRLVEVGTLVAQVRRVLDEPERCPRTIPLWDGKTARRVVESLQRRTA
jgi:UDP-N-acetylglucosamine 2-epimerase (non-hydrolysing)